MHTKPIPRLRRVFQVTALLAVAACIAACSGGTPGTKTGTAGDTGVRAHLQRVEYGRLVDIYAYRRVDPNNPDRLHPSSRQPVLIERDVLVDPFLRSEDPFATTSARYRFMPYDPWTGHRELLILFDDQNPNEREDFAAALAEARNNLTEIRVYAAFQPGPQTPAPVVPNDASFKLTFDRELGVPTEFFTATRVAVQVLELVADPEVTPPQEAYRQVPVRIVSKNNGKNLIIDPEVSGREAVGRNPNPAGMPLSSDQKAANLRIALPTTGFVNEIFRFAPDSNPTQNSVDVRNEEALVRDFRVANTNDPDFGGLPGFDQPELRAVREMGIMGIEEIEEDGHLRRILTINKRYADLVIRGRVPFVDGPLATPKGVPVGPSGVPQNRPFQYGDMIYQDIRSPDTGEVVRVKAEVIRNLDIVDVATEKDVGTGGGNPVARLEVSTLSAVDSQGNEFRFKANTLPLGETCIAMVNYHDQVEIASGNVGDGAGTKEEIDSRQAEFLTFDPTPPRLDANRNVLPPNANVSPTAAVIVNFSKPMAMVSVRSEDNVVLANWQGSSLAIVNNAKTGNLVAVPTSATDVRLDATSVRLNAPQGLYHIKNNSSPNQETYYVYVKDGETGALDRAGQSIDLFDDKNDLSAIRFQFTLDPEADSNLVAYVQRRMNDPDEDGTSDSGVVTDYFGQFQHDKRLGRLMGAAAVRFPKNSDRQQLSLVVRGDQGECPPQGNPPVPIPPLPLYGTNMLIGPGPAGGIPEPFVVFGMRQQQTFREDDFGFSNRNPFDFEIDVEQMYWAPWVLSSPKILYDVFDRVTITLATSEKRPDIRVAVGGMPAACMMDPNSATSGLMPTFEKNYIDNGTRSVVVKDEIMVIDPNDIFTTETGETMISYPKFKSTYTWRDRRIVSWDPVNEVAIGLGGSQNATGNGTIDWTTDITSPWIPEKLSTPSGYDNTQPDDFKGNQNQDFNPIALPLLMDFFVYPDDGDNGNAQGVNLFQLAAIGPNPPVPGHGYYNSSLPWMRVFSRGHRDPTRNLFVVKVDPPNELVARGGWVIGDPILGTFLAAPGDDHQYWSRTEFVRKVSVVTYGYVDLLKPALNQVDGPTGWVGKGAGFPDLEQLPGNLGPGDFAILMRPSPNELPPGTKVVIEYRGSNTIARPDIYVPSSTETAANRNNLLNPNYACEQYRYTHSGRVNATGVTPYVEDPKLLVDPNTGVAPRYLNFRITFVNNVDVQPALVPYVDQLAIIYRGKTTN